MRTTSGLSLGTTTALAICLAAPHAAMSADTNGNYALRGVGSASCNTYTEALENDTTRAQAYIAWMAGYITARNRTGAETFDVLPLISGADVAGLMRVVCLQNSDTSFEGAVDAALNLFYPARVKEDSPLLQLEHDGRQISIRVATLAQVQAALSKKGLYSSSIDGAYGPSTRTAIQEFQKSRKLNETGLPDADTLVALLLAE